MARLFIVEAKNWKKAIKKVEKKYGAVVFDARLRKKGKNIWDVFGEIKI